jgi:hypothetical protein
MTRTLTPIYVSVDIEADGPIPGPHSMLSLGAAAFDITPGPTDWFTPISTFEINLQPLPGSHPDPDTAAWWKARPEAYAAATRNPQDPATAIPKFTAWLRQLPGKPVCVAYPAGFDYTFVHWYNTRFDPQGDPFGFSCLDIKTLVAAALDIPFHAVSKRRIPADWFKPLVLAPDGRRLMLGKAPAHTHEALQDAIGQGILFINAHSAAALNVAGSR